MVGGSAPPLRGKRVGTVASQCVAKEVPVRVNDVGSGDPLAGERARVRRRSIEAPLVEVDARLQGPDEPGLIRERKVPSCASLCKATPWSLVADDRDAACGESFQNSVSEVLPKSWQKEDVVVPKRRRNVVVRERTTEGHIHMRWQVLHRGNADAEIGGIRHGTIDRNVDLAAELRQHPNCAEK